MRWSMPGSVVANISFEAASGVRLRKGCAYGLGNVVMRGKDTGEGLLDSYQSSANDNTFASGKRRTKSHNAFMILSSTTRRHITDHTNKCESCADAYNWPRPGNTSCVFLFPLVRHHGGKCYFV